MRVAFWWASLGFVFLFFILLGFVKDGTKAELIALAFAIDCLLIALNPLESLDDEDDEGGTGSNA